MKITKHLERKILRDFVFIKGNIELDHNYFIDKIKKGVNEDTNQNFKTNIHGKMTSWKYFLGDSKLNLILMEIFEYLDNSVKLKKFNVDEAWGFEEGQGGKTYYHDHEQSYLSGVLYLSKVNQPLKFKEINEEVEVDVGNFAIFSSWLEHGCDKNLSKDIKYGISFNSHSGH